MIGISKLYLNKAESSDYLRYTARGERKPVIVWNITRRCNLDCLHCYAGACREVQAHSPEEVSFEQARAIIDDLAGFGAPVLLFSGGEPLLREDLPELAAYASAQGLRTVLSSNGTMLNAAKAKALKRAGVSYVGISLDGLASVHNRMRRSDMAFELALSGLAAAREAGLKTGLRVTLTQENIPQISDIFKLVIEQGIDRICFYHLVGAGRGRDLAPPLHHETRLALDMIISSTRELWEKGVKTEVLTVDNHADGPYLWMRVQRENPRLAERVWELLSLSGGGSSGLGIAAINWQGDVLPDQFWQNRRLGNVLEQPFAEIWAGRGRPADWPGPESVGEFLARLRDKQAYVQGRCARCRFISICRGGFRARADLLYGNPWAEDPACYLSDAEISGYPPYQRRIHAIINSG
ncbi:MAG: radical SAM protein [Desulfovibrionaceae bacterium]|nr:radical SAM protein [Desulfovibrionaceae bacterium]